jgi:hypothetical protein
LALSLFKGYPLGTIVVKKEKRDEHGIVQSVNYLLDGRQRRETLMGMQDPETIYAWARRALRLRPSDTKDDVILKFKNYVTEYFYGQEDWEEEITEDDPPLSDVVTMESDVQDLEEAEEEESPPEKDLADDTASSDIEVIDEGLDELMKIILLVHPVTKAGRESGFRTPFNFDAHVKGLDFIKRDDKGRRYVESRALLAWLKYQRDKNKGTPWPPTAQQFLEWLTADKEVDKPDVVQARMSEEWSNIERSLRLLESLRLRLSSSVLGYLEIRDGAKSSDDKKIFEIINTAGTKLSAAEILSAKASWDATVDEPPAVVVDNVGALYEEMGILFDGSVRRWDVTATLLDRVAFPLVLGDPASWQWAGIKAKRLERKITLGFKIMSGYYQGKLMKDQIAMLPSTSDVHWNTLTFEHRVNEASVALGKHWFFDFARAWGFSFMDTLSDAVGLNFMLMMLLDWERKLEPKSGAPLNSFNKNGVILFDRLIYEYVTEAWRGSSDNRISRNIDELRSSESPAIFAPVPQASWEKLVRDVVEAGTIGGTTYLKKQDPRIRLLLLYAMVIAHLRPDDAHEMNELDHIIPQRLFKESGDRGLKENQHHISNLELLPESANGVKSGRRLTEVGEPHIRHTIARFSLIPEVDFTRFSDVGSSALLRERRGDVLKALLIDERARLLSDPDVHKKPLLSVDSQRPQTRSIDEVIGGGEGNWTEFKESARWSHIAGNKEKESELEIVRSLAAFMNARGGSLLIGVNNDGDVVGLGADYKSIQKSPNRDGFLNWLTNDVIRPRLGVTVTQFLTVSFESYPQGEVCRIDVRPSTDPVYVDKKRFFMRANSTTQELNMEEAMAYVAERRKG